VWTDGAASVRTFVVFRARITIALSLLALFGLTGVARSAVELVPLGSFDTPMQVVAAPGDDTRLFVVEQAGRIKVVHPDGTRNVFLDVSRSISSGGERGLLSIAFAPDYATTGLFFIFYTPARTATS
jgi:glucose/arabinose dehydrogenase